MPKISNLNAGELKNLISEAEKLLRQRGKLDVVIRDIEKVLARHKLKKAEIAEVLKLMQESGGPRRAAGAAPNKRSQVASKYKNPASNDKWTGRGRAPRWVAAILSEQGLTIEAFKADPRFKI
jgi:DNA-binding protein H-NS